MIQQRNTWLTALGAGMIAAMMTFPVAASATAIDIAGFVDPTNAQIIDNNDGTSTVNSLRYHFNVVLAQDSGLDRLQVAFEKDVFDLGGATVAQLDDTNAVTNTDWSSATLDVSSLAYLRFTRSSLLQPLTVGQSFSFTLDNLLIVDNSALTSSLLWNEGQIWGQSYVGIGPAAPGTGLFGLGIVASGGSTEPVPEPGTLLLMGTGLLGLGLWRRTRQTA